MYIGSRERDFKNFIGKILKIIKLNKISIAKLTDDESMQIWNQIFTHKSCDEHYNYEQWELMGDVTANKAIVWYFLRDRFPQLFNPKGVKVVTRLKIRYVSKKAFSDFAKVLDFWPFISAEEEVREKEMKPVLEDVFEAFIAGLEFLIDKKFRKGVGYIACYTLIKKLFDKMDISLKYEELYDAITRLKETQDYWNSAVGREILNEQKKTAFGRIRYENTRVVDPNTGYSIQYVHIYQIIEEKRKEVRANIIIETKIIKKIGQLASASAALLPDAKQKAAEIALETLRRAGLSRPIDPYYTKLGK